MNFLLPSFTSTNSASEPLKPGLAVTYSPVFPPLLYDPAHVHPSSTDTLLAPASSCQQFCFDLLREHKPLIFSASYSSLCLKMDCLQEPIFSTFQLALTFPGSELPLGVSSTCLIFNCSLVALYLSDTNSHLLFLFLKTYISSW